MFSHTIKGQLYNMELLSKFLAKQDATQDNLRLPRLIDYELLTSEDGKRSVGFGWFAGGQFCRGSYIQRAHDTRHPYSVVAGTLESLCALAHAHLELGVASPFLVSLQHRMHVSVV